MPYERIACVHLPHVATAIEERDNSALAGRPIAVEAPQPGPRVVYDLSDSARRAGVARGMGLGQARKVCPELTVLPARPDAYRDTYRILLELLAELAPAVEPADPERSWLAATGLTSRGGAERTLAMEMARRVRHEIGLSSRIGMAHGKLTSKIVTQYLDGSDVMVLPSGNEVTFLGGLATRYLPVSEATQQRLCQLGLTKVHQFAALPTLGILPRFGYEGLRAYRLAHGEDDAKVRPWQTEPFLEASHAFEEPVDNRSTLHQVLDELSRQLARPLSTHYQMAGAMTLTVTFTDDRTVRRDRTMVEPIALPQRLCGHADTLMADIPWEAPIERVALAVRGLCPTIGRQLDLFRQAHDDHAKVVAALQRVQLRYGPVVQQGHLLEPDAPLPERRAYAAPWEAT